MSTTFRPPGKVVGFLLCLLLVAAVATAQNWKLPWNSINSGGKPGTSTNFGLNGSLAQPLQGKGSSTNYLGSWGFWYGLDRGKVHDVGVTDIPEPPDTSLLGSLTPTSEVTEFGDAVGDTANIWFRILDSAGAEVYRDSGYEVVDSLSSVNHAFLAWAPPAPGFYTAISWTECKLDYNKVNDTFVKPFYIIDAPSDTGWVQKADVPLGTRSRKVRDGGCLTYDEQPGGYGYIYALKGNNTCEFYRYGTVTNTWTTKDSMPELGSSGRRKTVREGASLAQTGHRVYATKGNNSLEFWSYQDNLDYPWTQLPDVPTGTKLVREGTGAAAVTIGDTSYIYLLKGSATQEFYRYNITNNMWQQMADAPLGVSGKLYRSGSCITFDGVKTLYLLKGVYNEYFSYDVETDAWTTKRSMPLIGRTGRKKAAKDGAGLAFHRGMVYAFKGANTFEFWRYDAVTDSWTQMPDVPVGTGRRVRGGGGVVYADKPYPAVYGLKGNNSMEFWRYGLLADLAEAPELPEAATGGSQAHLTFALSVAPNPATAASRVSYSLPQAGNVNLRLFDVTGKTVATLAAGRVDAGSYSLNLNAARLSRGIYVLRLNADERTLTQKLIIE